MKQDRKSRKKKLNKGAGSDLWYDDAPKYASGTNNMRRLIPYMRGQSVSIIWAATSMIINGLVGVAMLYMFERVLKEILRVSTTKPDQVVSQLKDLIRNQVPPEQIVDVMNKLVFTPTQNWQPDFQGVNKFVFLMILIGIIRAVSDFGQTYFTTRIGQRVLTRLRSDLFTHFQSLSIGFFEKKRTGELMSRMTNDLSSLQGLMTQAITTTIRSPIETIGGLVYMFSKDWKLSLLLLVILPPMAFLVNRAGKQIRRATAQMQSQIANLTNYLQEKMSAMRLIQTFGTQEHEISVFEKVNQESYRRAMVPSRIKAILAPSIEFIGLLGVLLALWVGSRSMTDPEALIVFLFAGHRSAMNLKALASLNTMYRSAEASAERLFEMLDTQPDVKDAPNAIELRERQVKGHLKFEDVRFAYSTEKEVLHGVSFEIKPGEVVALAGLSGSGKTTISNLVPRLYDPKSGRVTIDDLDLRAVKLASLRSHIGAVPQETLLFHGTIRENISYGTPKATMDQVLEAARRAHADEFIQNLPQGYDTVVGERGSRLSGGQKQRIAIARALLRDPRILILDEATSSLDAESEGKVQDALDTLMRGRTTLIIAHRFSTIRHANRIIVLNDGYIAETGTHDELLALGGIYSRLYQMQTFARQREEEEDLDVEDEEYFDDDDEMDELDDAWVTAKG